MPVNIHTASIDELLTIKGVGQVWAESLVSMQKSDQINLENLQAMAKDYHQQPDFFPRLREAGKVTFEDYTFGETKTRRWIHETQQDTKRLISEATNQTYTILDARLEQLEKTQTDNQLSTDARFKKLESKMDTTDSKLDGLKKSLDELMSKLDPTYRPSIPSTEKADDVTQKTSDVNQGTCDVKPEDAVVNGGIDQQSPDIKPAGFDNQFAKDTAVNMAPLLAKGGKWQQPTPDVRGRQREERNPSTNGRGPRDRSREQAYSVHYSESSTRALMSQPQADTSRGSSTNKKTDFEPDSDDSKHTSDPSSLESDDDTKAEKAPTRRGRSRTRRTRVRHHDKSQDSKKRDKTKERDVKHKDYEPSGKKDRELDGSRTRPKRRDSSPPDHRRRRSRRDHTDDSDENSSSSEDSDSSDSYTRRRGHRRHNKSPTMPRMVVYNGTGNWEAFRYQFERIAKRCHWTGKRKTQKLIDCLSDVALEYAHRLKLHDDYDRLVKELERRFKKKDAPSAIRKQLLNVKQTEGEDIEDFSQRVHFLVIDGYPGADPDTIHQIAVEVFLKGCKDKRAAEIAMEKDPVTVYKALKYVKNATDNHKLLYGSSRPSVSHRQVTFANPVESQEMEDESPSIRLAQSSYKSNKDWEQVNKNIAQLTSVVSALATAVQKTSSISTDTAKQQSEGQRTASPQPGYPTRRFSSPISPQRLQNIECYNCHKKGHFRGDCPEKSPEKNVECYNCHKKGHYKGDCPEKSLNGTGLMRQVTGQPK